MKTIMGTTWIKQHYYLFLLDMSFYLESLRSGNSCQCITWYGRTHFFLFLGWLLVYILFLFIFFFIFTIYVKQFLLNTLMNFSLFAITNVAKPFCSFFIQFLWCQPCRLWKSRSSNTSLFIEVSGRLPCRHNFTFKFSCQPECLLQLIRFQNLNFMLDVIL